MHLLPLLFATLAACEPFTVALLDQTHSALSKHAEDSNWGSKQLNYGKNLAEALVDRLEDDINELYGETKKFAIAGGNSLANYLDVSSGSHDPLLIIVNHHDHEKPQFNQEDVYRARALRETVTPEMRGQQLANVVKELMEVVKKSTQGLHKRTNPNSGPGYCGGRNFCPVFCPGCLIEDLGEGEYLVHAPSNATEA